MINLFQPRRSPVASTSTGAKVMLQLRNSMIVHALSKAKVPLIALCSYGRSGTTVYMKLLKQIGVNVEGDVPFEDRTLQVSFLKWLAAQLGTGASDEAARPSNRAIFGNMTYNAGAAASWPGGADEFESKAVQWLIGLHKEGKRGVAEKFVGGPLFRSMKSFDDNNLIRPIFLLRDPRDVFISVKKFNEKRGYSGFKDQGDDQKLFNTICGSMREQLRMQRRFGGLVCRYEDLIINARRTIYDTVKYCSPEAVSAKFIDEVHERFSQMSDRETTHMTSATTEQSIERWRHHDFSDFGAVFDSMKPAIAEIGYPI